ncbi:DUF3291 domain-containing protein [Ktedonospora formicarum]|uniref:DUF3291 domain-containing protein n=1 Tax=Ktedonospora formicarum TaxID=2778364 RepID=A0A8J3MUL4_9CHLR|nr:DUF3291 domain-containing protein [Ktedonospora formicarum]GHO49482.1 hypothetical protein KSX_76450 [Ktedonospora formicarum]
MYQLAQVNIGRMRAPLSDPLMEGFVNQLEPINALADNSPGFVWRLQSSEGDATSLRVYEDDMILINLSVWSSLRELSDFIYASAHRDVMKQRRQWFERFEGVYIALWWVPEGHIPTAEEAKERLEHLQEHGPTSYAFTYKQPFAPADSPQAAPEPVTDECMV